MGDERGVRAWRRQTDGEQSHEDREGQKEGQKGERDPLQTCGNSV